MAYHVYQENLILEISCIAKEPLLHVSKDTPVDGCVPMLISSLCSLYIMRNILEAESIKVTSSLLAESSLVQPDHFFFYIRMGLNIKEKSDLARKTKLKDWLFTISMHSCVSHKYYK